MNKKILAVLMALMMVLTSAVAFAAVSDATQDQLTTKPTGDATEIEIEKTHTGEGKPAETFTFAVYTDADCKIPAKEFTNVTIEIAAGAEEGTVSLLLPEYTTNADLGEHIFYVKETAGNYAGVKYSEKVYKLTVTVYAAYDENGTPVYKRVASIRPTDALGTKVTEAAFVNNYTAYDMDITKKFSGNSADIRDTFEFTVTIEAPANTVLANAITYTVTDGENGTEKLTVGDPTKTETDAGITKYTYVITGVGKDDSVKFKNLPKDCTYTVEESNNKGSQTKKDYNCSNPNGTGTITADTSVEVTNSLDQNIDTGVNTDSMPYIMLMAFVMIMAVAVVLKKRTVNE